MSKIKCPCCGKTDLSDIKNFGNEPKIYCLSCQAEWWESQRQPPALPPEAVWEWFCERAFSMFKSAKTIAIIDEDDDYGDDFIVNVDIGFEEASDPKLVGITNGGHYPIMSSNGIKALGWTNMPPVNKKDVQP